MIILSPVQKRIITLLAFFACMYTSYWYGKISNPPKIIVETKTVTVEKIVQVETHKKDQVKKVQRKVVEEPSGKRETLVTEITKTIFEKRVDTSTVKDTKADSKSVKTVNKYSNFKVGVSLGTSLWHMQQSVKKLKKPQPNYFTHAAARVIGPWWVDTHVGWSTKSGSIGVSMEF